MFKRVSKFIREKRERKIREELMLKSLGYPEATTDIIEGAVDFILYNKPLTEELHDHSTEESISTLNPIRKWVRERRERKMREKVLRSQLHSYYNIPFCAIQDSIDFILDNKPLNRIHQLDERWTPEKVWLKFGSRPRI